LISKLIPIFIIFGLIQFESDTPVNDKPLTDIFEIGTVQSLIIHKNGASIAEHYRGTMHGERTVNIKSASKSVLSLLIGIAIDQNFIDGTDQTIDIYFPDYFEENPDPIKSSLTIQDLLTMRTGLETTSFRNYGRWALSSSWIHFALNQPIVDEPGGNMIYSTGTSHLLSVILTRATGMSTLAFANRYLFNPLDIQVGGWDRGPEGYYMGGNNMALSPKALVKIGELMMNMGSYNGETIVSKEWIMESIQVYTRSNFNPYDYGYMWWSREISEHKVYFAWGNGGQYIMILPELDAVLSITSSLSSNGSRRYQQEIFQFLGDVLIPFIESHDS